MEQSEGSSSRDLSRHHEVVHQCPVLVVGVGIGIVGRLAVDAAGHDKGAGCAAILEEEAEVVTHTRLCPSLIVSGNLRVAVGYALGVAMVGSGSGSRCSRSRSQTGGRASAAYRCHRGHTAFEVKSEEFAAASNDMRK